MHVQGSRTCHIYVLVSSAFMSQYFDLFIYSIWKNTVMTKEVLYGPRMFQFFTDVPSLQIHSEDELLIYPNETHFVRNLF